MRVAPTIYLGARVPETLYVYEDPEHPDRVTRTVASPAWIDEDHGLLLALAHVEQLERGFGTCRCGHPAKEAWNPEMDGWYEVVEVVCHACTAASDDGEVKRQIVRNTRPVSKGPLPPFSLD